MKKSILILLAATFVSLNISAQDNGSDSGSKLRIGVKAGLNYSNVFDAQGEDFVADNKFGFAAGAFFSIPIGEYIGVQPEILFSQKGFKATGSILGSGYEFTRTTNFIDVPLMASFKPFGLLTLLAGPQFSYLMKQTDVFVSATTTLETQQEFANENIRKNILCFLGGADINLGTLVLGARVGWDISKNSGDGTSSTPRYKNAWYQGTLGFRF